MRIKKGFTLAEILIVLMVIGVIATMTVPSLMKGVNEATYKTAFKKAYNAVTNIASVEKIAGQLPATSNKTGATQFFASLNSNLSVKEYYPFGSSGDITKVQTIETAPKTYDTAVVGDSTFTIGAGGEGVSTGTNTLAASKFSPWIVTEDGLAYAVTYVDNSKCGTIDETSHLAQGTKAYINKQDSLANALLQTCVLVAVDVNGIAKGPNLVEGQVITNLTSTQKLDQLVGDRYYIFVGSDGVATGPKGFTVSGRLLNDMK